jgi:hypothetical protein
MKPRNVLCFNDPDIPQNLFLWNSPLFFHQISHTPKEKVFHVGNNHPALEHFFPDQLNGKIRLA